MAGELERNIGVVAVFVETDGRVLLGVRKNAYQSGMYGAPGGRVHEDERIQDALIREVREETGVLVDDPWLFAIIRDEQRQNVFVHFAFLCAMWGGSIRNMEPEKCEGWEFFDPQAIPENTLPGHRAAIETYLELDDFAFKERRTPRVIEILKK